MSAVTFDQLNASLLNKSISFIKVFDPKRLNGCVMFFCCCCFVKITILNYN